MACSIDSTYCFFYLLGKERGQSIIGGYIFKTNKPINNQNRDNNDMWPRFNLLLVLSQQEDDQ